MTCFEAVNRQRKIKLDTKAWAEFAAKAADALGQKQSSATIAFVSDKTIRQLNRQFRGVDKATDVLSFPAELRTGTGTGTVLGDIVLARGVAGRQAREHGHTLQTELRILALHGLLHLIGYDHEDVNDRGRMRRAEDRLRRKGGLARGLIGRARGAQGR